MALRSISGTLAAADLLPPLARPPRAVGQLRNTLVQAARSLGPASSARLVFDLLMLPLLDDAGLSVAILREESSVVTATFAPPGDENPLGVLTAGSWGADLQRLRDRAARERPGVRWWIGGNGTSVRIMDASRAFTKRALDFDLADAADDDEALAVLQRLLRPGDGGLNTLEALVEQTGRHRLEVGRFLQAGVETALTTLMEGFSRGPRGADPAASFPDALTVVYRILFLLFAEARGLVPQWHPVYRESYTIESLRPLAEARGSPAGLWEALRAISRLAHRGCTAGTLRVVPFNGRLFAPAAAPLADSFRLDDRIARQVLLAVTTRPGQDRRERISYRDLGVEQLGAVYERVLDYTPGGERRKGTGTFYTPRSMTEYLVRRTLAPLVRRRTPEQVLSLRVLDPAMGSGAFLVASCRYLAHAYEQALIAEGTVTRADVSAADRAGFRRVVAQRCVYGVDTNPTAVQLARLSLWLCTLAADRPLNFLDHHLRTGNSLVGATTADVARQPPGRSGRRCTASLPLFDAGALADGVSATIGARSALALTPDDTAAIVRNKERALDRLQGAESPLASWRACADAWCAAWFWPDTATPLTPKGWPALLAGLRGRPSTLPRDLERHWIETAGQVAAASRFFHWELEFPELFFDATGNPLASPGFDAVIGNPPWADARSVAGFARESGCYRLQGRGHANLYQLFAERMLQLTAHDGRVGMLMPSGLLADHGCADLRRYLFERTEVDAVVGFDNRDALFPIHRGLRFSLITATHRPATAELQTRFGLRAAAALDDVPDAGEIPGSVRVPLTLVRRFGGESLAIPELGHERDRLILARVVAGAPPLGAAEGWNVRFGRELNATDDRPHFGARGLPVVEGKHIEAFGARPEEAQQFIDAGLARHLLGSRAQIHQPRLGYREVASSTNRMTLIAAMIPAGVVTTHTIFCLREPADTPADVQWFLCGMFNSFVANYLVRLRGGTHLPAATIHQLPMPLLGRDSPLLVRLSALAQVAGDDLDARTELQALAAAAYGLDEDAFAHVLRSFPLVPDEERHAAHRAFLHWSDGI